MELILVRIKVFLSPQLDWVDATPSDVLRDALLEKPTTRGRRLTPWHIGNTEAIDQDALYCRLGRTARSSRSRLDPNSGNFVEEPFEHAPYTHVLCDTRLEVAGVVRKADLAPTPERLVEALADVLNSSRYARARQAQFDCNAISDPERFLASVRSAFAVRSFTITFTKPNPWDVNAAFVRPMEELAAELDGAGGSTTVRGVALKKEAMEELTRSAAASGDNARARIIPEVGEGTVTRSLRGDTVTVPVESLDEQQGRADAVAKVRSEYSRVRGQEGPDAP